MSASTPPPSPLAPSPSPRIKRSKTPMGWRRWVPGLSAIRQYRIAWLRHDIGAGLALTAVLLPVGIAYVVWQTCQPPRSQGW